MNIFQMDMMHNTFLIVIYVIMYFCSVVCYSKIHLNNDSYFRNILWKICSQKLNCNAIICNQSKHINLLLALSLFLSTSKIHLILFCFDFGIYLLTQFCRIYLQYFISKSSYLCLYKA